MIVPMKKATLLVLSADTRSATDKLKRLGMLHPVVTAHTSSDLDSLQAQLQRVDRALSLLPVSAAKRGDGSASAPAGSDVEALLDEVFSASESGKALQDEIAQLIKEEQQLANWGDFDPGLIAELEKQGIAVSLAILSPSQLAQLRDEHPELKVFTVRATKAAVYAAIVGRLPDDSEFHTEPVPDRSLRQVQLILAEKRRAAAAVEERLRQLAERRREIELYRQSILEQVEFATVESSLEQHGAVAAISGYVPADKADEFKAQATRNNWGVVLADPGPDDEVPTLVRNPRAVRIIQPVFDMLGTVPGYREHDISLWFLLFFTIFFAMIIGDAGYGALILLACIWLIVGQKKKQKPVPDGLVLGTVLSAATVAWGAITGNWFGYQPIAELPGFRALIIPSLNAFDPRSAQSVQLVCFVIGTVHIVLAHVLQFVKQVRERNLQCVAQLGWMTTVLGLYYLVLNLVISNTQYPIPNHAVPMIVGGMITVLLFQNQERDGFFRGVMRSLGGFITTALSGVSSFSDIISYIRLFAVGLSGAEIAKSFNGMAVGMMESGVVGLIAGLLIILAGHALNMAMAGLSVMVHGVRLNTLEFSNHVGNEWAGFAYRPFAYRPGSLAPDKQ